MDHLSLWNLGTALRWLALYFEKDPLLCRNVVALVSFSKGCFMLSDWSIFVNTSQSFFPTRQSCLAHFFPSYSTYSSSFIHSLSPTWPRHCPLWSSPTLPLSYTTHSLAFWKPTFDFLLAHFFFLMLFSPFTYMFLHQKSSSAMFHPFSSI